MSLPTITSDTYNSCPVCATCPFHPILLSVSGQHYTVGVSGNKLCDVTPCSSVDTDRYHTVRHHIPQQSVHICGTFVQFGLSASVSAGSALPCSAPALSPRIRPRPGPSGSSCWWCSWHCRCWRDLTTCWWSLPECLHFRAPAVRRTRASCCQLAAKRAVSWPALRLRPCEVPTWTCWWMQPRRFGCAGRCRLVPACCSLYCLYHNHHYHHHHHLSESHH